MDYKVRLKIGLLVTALITVLLISDIMAPLFAAIIFLLVGISLSYFLASDVVKERKIKEMAVITKALESISLATDKLEVLRLLESWAQRLVICEESYMWIKDVGEPEKFKQLIEHYSDCKEPQLIDDKLAQGFSTILFIPLIINGVTQAVLILADNDAKNLQSFHVKLLQPLIKIAVGNIENILDINRKKIFEKNLFLTLIKAGEGFNLSMIGHAERVAKIAVLIGKRLGLNNEELESLEYGSLLHDIGQSAVLFQGLKSDGEEEVKHASHPVLGAQLIPDSTYVEIKEAILYHHEHYDGTGYPEGLKYTDIPLVARIIAVADTYDALTCLASEEERVSHDKALIFIKRALGTWFDPLVVVALEEVGEEVREFLKVDEKNDDK